ncbi:MAG: hypothetical protein KDI82_17005 [Gammaproteobacteria bacterium]|nr:hypothetical protein [Gammaproteobacteria bacterium]
MSEMDILPPEIGKLRLRNEPTAVDPSEPTLADVSPEAEDPQVVTEADAQARGSSDTDQRVVADLDPVEPEKPLNSQPVESEASAQDLAVPTPEPSAVLENVEPIPRCARIGPLKPEQADDLIRALPAHLQLLADTSSEQRVATGYYVLVPPLPSRAEGLAKLNELREAGFRDVWLFRGGEFRNAISLGLYSNAAGAQRHARDVARKGFEVEVRDKTSVSERRWLLLQYFGEARLNEFLPLPESTDVEAQPCP